MPKKKINCNDITALELQDKDDTAVTLRVKFVLYASDGLPYTYDWLLKLTAKVVPPGRSQKEVMAHGLMWYRKIARCSPQVVDPTLSEAQEAVRRHEGRQITIDRQLGSIARDARVFGALNRFSRRRSSNFMGGVPLLKSK